MIEVAIFLDLPRFPDITEDCYLHPNTLCMKYLLEVNLPGELWCARGGGLAAKLCSAEQEGLSFSCRLLKPPEGIHSNRNLIQMLS